MKKLFGVLFVGILLLSLSSAQFSWDNKKTFNQSHGPYGRATITNALGLGAKIMDIDLLENTDVCPDNNCKAVGKVILYSNSKLIDSVRMRKSKVDNSESKSIKGSGLFIKKNNKWKLYHGETLRPGTYEWMISGRIKPGESSDWVGKWAGIEVPEWAVWSSEFQVRIIADNVTEATLEINNVTVTDEGNGTWKVNTSESDYEVSRAQVMKTFFYGTNGTDPRIVSGTTNVSRLLTLDHRDLGKRGHFASIQGGLADFTSSAQTGTFIDTTNNDNVSVWSRVFIQNSGSGADASFRFPVGTIINGITITGENDEIGTDRTGDQKTNQGNVSVNLACSGCTALTNGDVRSIILAEDNITWVNSGASTTRVNTDFFLAHSIPAFSSSPNITINAPLDGSARARGVNVTFNISIVSLLANLSNSSLFLNGTLNETINISGNSNETTFLKVFSTFETISWFVEVCDTTNVCSESFDQSLTIQEIAEINSTFNEVTTEGTLEDFEVVASLSTGITVTAATLIYNGTPTIGATTSLGGDLVSIKKEGFEIPTVDTETNVSFFWSILLSNSNTINFSVDNQTILNIDLVLCSADPLFNLTQLDEEFQTNITNGTIEFDISIFNSDKTVIISQISNITTAVNPTQICLTTNLTNSSSYLIDAVIRYEAPDHANEYFNIVGLPLTNDTTTQNINLFDLNITDSTDFQLTFTGSDFLPVDSALVFINRQYISEGVFKTVEVPKTDANGQTILHLVRNDVVYNLIVTKNNEVLGTFNNVRAFCQDFTIDQCELTLNAISNDSGIFNYDQEIGIIFDSAPKFDSGTNIMSFSFVSSDASPRDVLMEVERRDVFGNISVCDNTVISTSGTLSCNVGSGLEDTSLVVTISVNEEPQLQSVVTIDTTSYGNIVYVFWFVLTLLTVLMFSDSKTGVMFALGISYVGAITMGAVLGNVAGLGSAGIWILIITVTAIWKLNKRKPE